MDKIGKYGVVTLVDALGARGVTIEQASKFLRNAREISNKALEHINTKSSSHIPEVLSFQDTIAIMWEIDDNKNKNAIETVLFNISTMLSFLIVEGLSREILFQGAISIGEYISDEKSVLGPAVTDAVEWYNQAEWFGAFATPYCSQFINEIAVDKKGCKDFDLTVLEKYFVSYDVPLKMRPNLKLWVVPWPDFAKSRANGIDPCVWYYKLLQNFPIPKNTEQKYFNTEQFFKTLIN